MPRTIHGSAEEAKVVEVGQLGLSSLRIAAPAIASARVGSARDSEVGRNRVIGLVRRVICVAPIVIDLRVLRNRRARVPRSVRTVAEFAAPVVPAIEELMMETEEQLAVVGIV